MVEEFGSGGADTEPKIDQRKQAFYYRSRWAQERNELKFDFVSSNLVV
jgi:hypothetical protein